MLRHHLNPGDMLQAKQLIYVHNVGVNAGDLGLQERELVTWLGFEESETNGYRAHHYFLLPTGHMCYMVFFSRSQIDQYFRRLHNDPR